MPGKVEPIINGHRYSYASVDVIVNGRGYVGVKRISYTSKLTPGIIYASDPQKVGRTPGKSEHDCTIEMYRREFNDMVVTLGQSFGRVPFNVQVQYQEPGDEGVTTDNILGCRVVQVEFPNEEGNESTVVSLQLDCMDIRLGKEGLSIECFDWEESVA